MKKKQKLLITFGLVLITVIAITKTISIKSKGQIPGTYVNEPFEINANSVQLNAPYISQKAIKAWNGCEAASLLAGLQSKGVLLKTDLRTFLKQMPRSKDNNPYNGYAGSPYIKLQSSIFQSIFPKALAKWGNRYHSVKDISGASINELKHQVKIGNPVVTYIVSYYLKPKFQKYFWGTGITNSHVVLLDGYEKGYYHVSDPNRGKYWVKANLFERSYQYKKYAVAIQ